MADDVYTGTPRNGRRRFSTPTSVKSFATGGASVGTTAASILGNFECNSGVRIQADSGNTQDIFVCNSSAGTTQTGFGLAGEAELFIDIDELNKVFLVAENTGMTARFVAS